MQSVIVNRKECTENPEAYIYKDLVEKTNMQCLDASVKVWLLWEGASDPSDDDVGGVVSGPDALLQRVLLNQCGEESWVDIRARGQPVNIHHLQYCLGSS